MGPNANQIGSGGEREREIERLSRRPIKADRHTRASLMTGRQRKALGPNLNSNSLPIDISHLASLRFTCKTLALDLISLKASYPSLQPLSPSLCLRFARSRPRSTRSGSLGGRRLISRPHHLSVLSAACCGSAGCLLLAANFYGLNVYDKAGGLPSLVNGGSAVHPP